MRQPYILGLQWPSYLRNPHPLSQSFSPCKAWTPGTSPPHCGESVQGKIKKCRDAENPKWFHKVAAWNVESLNYDPTSGTAWHCYTLLYIASHCLHQWRQWRPPHEASPDSWLHGHTPGSTRRCCSKKSKGSTDQRTSLRIQHSKPRTWGMLASAVYPQRANVPRVVQAFFTSVSESWHLTTSHNISYLHISQQASNCCQAPSSLTASCQRNEIRSVTITITTKATKYCLHLHTVMNHKVAEWMQSSIWTWAKLSKQSFFKAPDLSIASTNHHICHPKSESPSHPISFPSCDSPSSSSGSSGSSGSSFNSGCSNCSNCSDCSGPFTYATAAFISCSSCSQFSLRKFVIAGTCRNFKQSLSLKTSGFVRFCEF